MKKVLILSAILVLALSLPTFAVYQLNWTETFDYLNMDANIAGQNNWTTVTLAGTTARTSGKVMGGDTLDPAPISPGHYYKQAAKGTTVFAAAARDMRNGGPAFKRGRMDAWLYDYKLGTTNQTDTRVGVHSTVGNNNIGYIASVNVTDVGAGNVDYWRAQWSYTVLNLTGTTASAVGWTFTNPTPVPRVQGWNKVRIEFGYTYPAGSATATDLWVKWFINKAPTSELTLTGYDLMLTVTTAAGGRWTNMGSGIAGIFLGSTYGCGVNSAPIDDVVFKGNVVPEPTSLLALGTGLIGLCGLIRRKR